MARLTVGLAVVLLVVTCLVAQQGQQQGSESQTIAGRIGVVSGDGKAFTLKDYDNKDYALLCSPATKVRNSKGQQEQITALKPNTAVAIAISKENGQLNCFAVFESKSTQGKLSEVKQGSIKIGNDTMSVEPTARILIDSQQSKLSDLRPGDQVTVHYWTTESSMNVAGEIRAKR